MPHTPAKNPGKKTASKSGAIPQSITAARLKALNGGLASTANLAECLAVDQLQLMRAVFPDLPSKVFKQAEALGSVGILKRMNHAASILLDALGKNGIARCVTHESDTVRGWACFMIGARTDISLSKRISDIAPLADDPHFGVREWAWMAVRPHMVAELENAIKLLVPWAHSPSERIRRFASESLRPRGVWCSHIALLKVQPDTVLPVLEPLRSDPAKYVQDSVSNWLNDAAKDRPEWVLNLCERWTRESQSVETKRICARAQRKL